MSAREHELRQQLIAIAQATPWLMSVLKAVRQLGLAHWCVGAGAIRNLVWDALHARSLPSALPDVDVAYFDACDTSAARDAALQDRLQALLPGVPWEVTNQAGVHHWFGNYFGHPVPPLNSLEEAVASWPEYASSVGLTLVDDNSITVIAPHGLEDLFSMTVRRNPARVSIETYRQRIEQKQYLLRWPKVVVVPC